MGGVDLLDSMIGRYRNVLRSEKWCFRLFYHLLELVIVNAWFLHKRSCSERGVKPELGLAQFRTEIGVALCKYGQPITSSRGQSRNEVEVQLQLKQKKGPTATAPPKDVRLDQTLHWALFCDTCQRCKLPGCGAKTFSKCTKCDVHLCLHNKKNCFVTYHNQIYLHITSFSCKFYFNNWVYFWFPYICLILLILQFCRVYSINFNNLYTAEQRLSEHRLSG